MFSFNYSDMLGQTATIQRKSVTKDAGGSAILSWADQFADVPVSLQPLQGDKIEALGKLRIEADYVAYSQTVLDVHNGDRLACDGKTYEVRLTRDEGGDGSVFAIYTKLVTT